MSTEQMDLSSDILRANLGALWSRDLRLFDLAQAPPDDSSLLAIASDDGLPNLVKVGSGDPVAYYDFQAPLAGVERDLRAQTFDHARLVVLLGFGLGYELAYFFDEMAADARTQQILVVEPDVNVFRHAMRQVDMAKWLSDPRVSFVVGISDIDLEVWVERYLAEQNIGSLARSTHFAFVPGAMNFQREKLHDAMKRISIVIRHATRFAGLGPAPIIDEMRNVAGNLPRLVSAMDLGPARGQFAGYPAIVCSAGPSLRTALPLLRDLQDRAIIISADGALAALVKAGIEPHLVTAIDASPLIKNHLEGFSLPRARLVANAIIHPTSIGAWTGPMATTANGGGPYSRVGLSHTTIDVGLSSGNMAFRMARFLGCDTVILVGQDLSYSADGASHAEGTRHAERGLLESLPKEEILVASNDGKQVRTQYSWFVYKSDYERRLAGFAGRCINTSLTGARIEGTEVMPFDEAVKLLPPPFEVDALLDRYIQPRTPEVIASDVANAHERVLEHIPVARDVEAESLEAISLCEKLLSNWPAELFEGVEKSLGGVRSVPQLADLRARRRYILRPRGDLSTNFMGFVAYAMNSFFIAMNMRAYDAEKAATSANELARKIVEIDLFWFNVMAATASKSREAFEQCLPQLASLGTSAAD
jgi:hypothetical protein